MGGLRSAVIAAGTMLLYGTAMGEQAAETPSVLFNGFGTAALVHSNEENADFTSDGLVPGGAGFTQEWSAEVDSRLGLQATGRLTPRLSSAIQVVVEQRHDDTYEPQIEWANVKYEINPDLSVRAGRTVLPVFMVSEFRKVGFANPWVRPPPEVYQLVPITNFDGIDVSYRSRIGLFRNTLRGAYGRADFTSFELGDIRARDGFLLRDVLEYGFASFVATYTSSRIHADDVAPLFNGFRQFGLQGQALADRFEADGKRFETLSLGARYDPGDWFVMGEWARSQSRTFIRDKEAWYVTGGYRFGAFTPYVTIAGVDVNGRTSHPGLATTGLPPTLTSTAQRLNASLNDALGRGAEQNSISVGTRWDFRSNAAVKAQFDYIDLGSGSRGVLVNEQPGFRRGGTVSLFSVALDVVF